MLSSIGDMSIFMARHVQADKNLVVNTNFKIWQLQF